MSSQPRGSAGRTIKILAITACLGLFLLAGGYGAWKIRKSMMIRDALNEGNAAYTARDWETARKMFGRYLSAHPEDAEILVKYAESQLSVYPLPSSNVMQAIGAYRRVLRLNPRDDAAFKRIALLYEKIGDGAELAQVAANRLGVLPDDPSARLAEGKSLLHRQKLEEARVTLETLVNQLDQQKTKSPEYAEACVLLCSLSNLDAKQAGGPTSALSSATEPQSWLDRAIAYAPDSALAYVRRAALQRELASRAGQVTDQPSRISDLEKATELASDDPRVVLLLCDEWLDLGEYDRAAEQLERAERMDAANLRNYFVDPDDWVVARFAESAKLSLLRGTAEEGVKLARDTLQQLEDRPQRIQALRLAVELFIAGKQLEEARRAVAAFVDSTKTMQANAQLEEQTALLQALLARAEEQPYRVIELLEPIADRSGVLPMIRMLLAEAYTGTGQAGRMTKLLARVAHERSLTPDSAKMLARTLIQRGEWARALEALEPTGGAPALDADAQVLKLTARMGMAGEAAEPAKQKMLESIAGELEALRASHPERADVRVLLAMISERLGRSEQARLELRQAGEQCAEPLPAWLLLAQFCSQDDRFDEAQAVLRLACEKCGTQAAPWMALGEFLLNRGNIDSARATLREGLERLASPEERRRVAAALASVDITHGDADVGIKALFDLTRSNPSDVRIRTILLELPQVARDKTVAQPLIDELKTIEGERGLLWRLYQSRLWLAGDDRQVHQKEIETNLRYCIDADPAWAQPFLTLGEMYERLGDQTSAEGLYETGFRTSGVPEVADRLLSLLLRQKRIPEARDLLERLKRKLDARALETRQLALAIGEGQYQDAIGALELRVAADAGDPVDLVRLADLIYMQNRNAARALEYLDQAAARGADPTVVARARIGILYAESRQDEIEVVLDQLVSSAPTPEAYLLRGSYHAGIQRNDLVEQDYLALARGSKDAFGYAVLGEFYAQTQRLDAAIDAWRDGLALYPDSILLKRGLTKALLVRERPGDHEAADALLAELQTDMPDDAEVLWMRAVEKTNKGSPEDLEEARHLLKDAAHAPQASLDTYRGLANLAVQLGDESVARELVLRGLQAHPADPVLQMIQARSEFGSGNLGAARDIAQSLLRSDGANLPAHELLTEIAFSQKDATTLQNELTAFQQMRQDNPANDALPMLIARACTGLGKFEEALTTLREYLATDKGHDNIPAHLLAADVLRMKGDFSAAQEEIDATAILAPEHPALWHARLLLLGDQRRFDDIMKLVGADTAEPAPPLEVLRRASSILSGSPEHLDAAIALCRRALESSPRDVDGQMRLGNLTYQKGDFNASIQAFRAVIAEEPLNAEALNNLAWILAERQSAYDEALPHVRKAVALQPNDPNYRDTLGFVLKGQGKLPDARAEYRRGVELAPADTPLRARSLLHLSEVCYALKDWEPIPAQLNEALAIDRGNPTFTPEERAAINEMLDAARHADSAAAANPK